MGRSLARLMSHQKAYSLSGSRPWPVRATAGGRGKRRIMDQGIDRTGTAAEGPASANRSPGRRTGERGARTMPSLSARYYLEHFEELLAFVHRE